MGIFAGRKESFFAAMGCTLGIIPHLLASIFGLAAILHTSAVAFQIVKIIGVCYLFYLAYMMYKETGSLQIKGKQKQKGLYKIVLRGFLINILNPKLSIFFLAFLPQFISSSSTTIVSEMLLMSFVFMIMTFVVFVIYGFFAHKSSTFIQDSPKIMQKIQKGFAGIFVLLGMKLAISER
ncbi:lysine transporter LysE [Arcobacter sp. CECT 8983]|nr:lysine transporter LysE [Arcobacter sp. CECT 8983]